jgi:hypothetical protein
MLPLCTASVSKMTVCSEPVAPDGAVGSGEGAPAGAARLVVTFTVVPAATVVPDWKVMLALHEPSGGYVAGVPGTTLDMVPVLDAVVVLQGNVALAGVGVAAPLGVGVAVDVGPVVGVDPLDELPPQPTTAAAMRPKKTVARSRGERRFSIIVCSVRNDRQLAHLSYEGGLFRRYSHERVTLGGVVASRGRREFTNAQVVCREMAR